MAVKYLEGKVVSKDVKVAIVMSSCGVDVLSALDALKNADGFVRRAQETLNNHRSGNF